MADLVRWTFQDQAASTSYTFAINPDAGGTPDYKKKMTYQNTTAPNGKTLIFEGSREVRTLEWSGTIIEQAHLEALQTWWDKERQILLTDDLGRQFWIFITEFTPKRVRNSQRPWKHTYSMKATIVDWPAS